MSKVRYAFAEEDTAVSLEASGGKDRDRQVPVPVDPNAKHGSSAAHHHVPCNYFLCEHENCSERLFLSCVVICNY